MAKRRISKRAIRENFDAALEEDLPDDGPSEEDAMIAIAYVAWGRGNDVDFNLPDGVISAGQMIEQFNLTPFVDVVRKCNQDAARQGGFSPGDFVIGYMDIYRTLMRREVTAFAALRTENYEVLLETLDGKYFGFVGEGEVEKLRDTSAEALAQMVSDGELKFEQALQLHLQERKWNASAEMVKLAELAIGEASLGHFDLVMEGPKSPMTVAQVVQKLSLEPFITHNQKEEKEETRKDKKDNIPVNNPGLIQVVEAVVNEKVKAGDMFTAYDITLEVRNRGYRAYHNDVRDAVHDYYGRNGMGVAYTRTNISLPGGQPILYHRTVDDPSTYNNIRGSERRETHQRSEMP